MKDICVPPVLKVKILDKYLAKWVDEFQYLGSVFSRDLGDLYQDNVGPLIKKIKSQLQQWTKYQLSWMGHFTVIKMKILPRLLFLFLNAIIEISKKTNKGDSQDNKFIVGNYGSRIKLKVLQQQVPRGGLAVPNMELYYEAALLVSIMEWWKTQDGGFNRFIDKQGSQTPLKDWMIMNRKDRFKPERDNGWIPNFERF